MPKRTRFYYYGIYDDKEQFNYFKSTLEEAAIRKLLKKFEKTHQEYYNHEFMKVLKERDPKGEFIDVTTITY